MTKNQAKNESQKKMTALGKQPEEKQTKQKLVPRAAGINTEEKGDEGPMRIQ